MLLLCRVWLSFTRLDLQKPLAPPCHARNSHFHQISFGFCVSLRR
jgi:hypothetical protein